MGDLFEAYDRVRMRMIELVEGCDPDELARTVPACPDWSVTDLVAHCSGLPAALSSGDVPGGELQAWLDGLVEARRGRSLASLVEEWTSIDEGLRGLLSGGAGLLFDDLAVHEHDLRGAIGRADYDALDVDMVLPRTLAGLTAPLEAAGLGSIEARCGVRTWRSHDAPPGWVLVTTPWEVTRAVNSRRTADELRALPHEGEVEPYLAVLDAHLPLPTESLGEA
ncbi:maleylpyruvate isomerase N-terminal domain-containing protein [Rhabdothermincola salaria]|uniref:maleylpyruvate isomerase N-terminal domain-containing protein n=1 Tax=Rhabdothermincola salaria TaxID=2903142 RepID=UPI001E2A178E|nr:maleylpyruvate isomerase N-terminal domain-containing protein [Rhabdothermincola salaria]MCD9624997.1 hypothetical protein [Rhabdothermincola salaria]